MHSTVIAQDFEIFIGLPFGYDPTKSYPLVVVLDADVMFGLITHYAQLIAFEPTETPCITVGVGYGGFNQWLQGRNRVYHPAKDGQANAGAEGYLSFLETELLLFVFEHYSVNQSQKILYGHSSGGLFAVYAALTNPALFSSIIATSPSLEWQDEEFSKHIQLAEKETLPNLYISASKLETRTMASINKLIENQPFETGRFEYQIFDSQTHMGVIPEAYEQAIKWVFESK